MRAPGEDPDESDKLPSDRSLLKAGDSARATHAVHKPHFQATQPGSADNAAGGL